MPTAFVFEVVEGVEDANFVKAREQFWMWRTDCTNPEKGYNISEDAGSARGGEITDERREQARLNGLRNGISPQCRAARKAVVTPEMARDAQKLTVEARKHNGTYGHSDETRRLISESQKGRIATAETRARLSERISASISSSGVSMSRAAGTRIYSEDVVATIVEARQGGATLMEIKNRWRASPGTVYKMMNGTYFAREEVEA